MTSTRPRTAAIVLVLLTGLAASCGGSTKHETTPTSGPTTTSVTTSTTSPSATSTPATTPPALDTSTAVWPTAGSTRRFTDPVAAARSFATDYLKMVAPVVGAFRPGDPASGEVPIQATSRGPVTTVIVRRLGPGTSWWVLGSATPNIRLTEPAALATISSPVRLRGQSRAFEATVNYSVREDDNPHALGEGYTMGGSSQMGPFDTSVTYVPPKVPSGAIELYTISSESGHVQEATVIRVHFSGV
jgi:hypothetical protein